MVPLTLTEDKCTCLLGLSTESLSTFSEGPRFPLAVRTKATSRQSPFPGPCWSDAKIVLMIGCLL